MKTRIRVNNTILLISSIISFFWLVYILFQVNSNLPEALNIDKSEFGILDYLIGFGHLFVLIFNIYAIIMIFSHFRHFEKLKALRIILLVFSLVSLFSIGVEKVMVDEITKQYRFGMDVSEINILNFTYIINLSFALLMFYFILRSFPILRNDSSEKEPIDEKIFTIAQYMGILSGLMGLFLVFDLIRKEILLSKLIMYIPFCILFMIPYSLAVLYWISLKKSQKIKDWYDEKQLQDIMKASLTTLLLSFPGLLLFLLLGITSIFYFFLYYIFLVLVIFSGSTLFYYKL